VSRHRIDAEEVGRAGIGNPNTSPIAGVQALVSF
jgi:hypothetical protein